MNLFERSRTPGNIGKEGRIPQNSLFDKIQKISAHNLLDYPVVGLCTIWMKWLPS